MASRTRKGRVTPEEVEQIIEMKLVRRMSYREIAAEIGRDKDTVARHWNSYLEERAAEFAEELEPYRAELLLRLNTIADEARRRRLAAENDSDRIRYMAEERHAIAQIAKLLGLEQLSLNHSGGVGFTVIEISEEVDDSDVEDD